MKSKSEILRLTARSRPLRIAFLANPDTLAQEAFDNLIRRCMSAWGGGYWPIVPTGGSTISEDYWSLLEHTDPDLITSFTPLEPGLEREIHQRLAPASINTSLPSSEDDHQHVYRWSEDSPLTSRSVLAYHYLRRSFILPPNALWIKYSFNQRAQPAYQFVHRNFGIPTPTADIRDDYEAVPHLAVELANLSEADFLHQLGLPDFLPYRALSRLHAPRPFEPGYEPTPFRILVIGDTVADAIYAWNRAVVSNATHQVLWISEASTQDADFIDAFTSWAKYAFARSSHDPFGLLAESISTAPDLLDTVAQVVAEAAHLTPQTAQIEQGAFSFTTRPYTGLVWQNANGSSLGSPNDAPNKKYVLPSPRGAAAVMVQPPPFVSPSTHDGTWMVDLDIEDSSAPPRGFNQEMKWRLPRRPTVGRLFANQRIARVVVGGYPSVSASVRASTFTVRTPSPRAVAYALIATNPPEDDSPSHSFNSLSLSEQGRRFQALSDLFGGIYAAGQVLGDPFWRGIILKAIGDPVSVRAEQTATVRRILTEASSDISKDDLAARIAGRLHRPLPDVSVISKYAIKQRFHRFVNVHYKDTPNELRPDFEGYYWLDFVDFVEDGVFLQGAELRCPNCGLSRWHHVNLLSQSMTCPECLVPFSLPAEPEWKYKLNGLVHSALAREAVLPLIDAVFALAEKARTHVLILPPMELREEYDSDPYTDLDLFMLRDGQFLIGEVKSNAAGFDGAQLDKLIDVARAIVPDEVVLAAPVETWTAESERLAETVRAGLEKHAISLQLLRLTHSSR